ncbi:MAG: 4-(cytidine 5'-diphospho)-2-C-methyl-D-erythritol kinase [Lachnospiraceae bacterium]|nr:4-(cytidine 5'-diphospho)-2-C-methyl-D-erythritol kinase [Lachnospiraceae bacterium]
MKLKAYGKINLGLDVVRRREDGYHEVKMIMQTVNIYDRIFIKKNDSGEIKIKTNLFYLPNNSDNIMYKAAKLLFDEFGITKGLDINLQKNIPVSAGMAGGSTDAAAVMFGINVMFRLGLSIEELMEHAVKIGADVPYCLLRGTALSEGIGEKLTRLSPPPNCFIVIAKPGFGVSTKHVYQNLNLDGLERHPDIDGLMEAIKNKDLKKMSEKMENVLETVTAKEHPEIDRLKQLMVECGACVSLMSGSGPTVFGLFEKKEDANKAKEIIVSKKLAKQVFVTRFFNI